MIQQGACYWRNKLSLNFIPDRNVFQPDSLGVEFRTIDMDGFVVKLEKSPITLDWLRAITGEQDQSVGTGGPTES